MSSSLKSVAIFISGAIAGSLIIGSFQSRTTSPPKEAFTSPAPTECPSTATCETSPDTIESSPKISGEIPKSKCMEILGLYDIPLLDPPTLHSSVPQELSTNYEGEARMKWLPVPRAKSYFVVVENPAGAEIRSYKTSHAVMYLKGLPKAASDKDLYYVKIASINANDVIGKFGNRRKLWVKKPLDLTAPRIKEIRIED